MANTLPTGKVVIRGIPYTGVSTDGLTADLSLLLDADGYSIADVSYNWLVDGLASGVTTDSIVSVDPAWVGKLISLQISYTDAGGTPETVTSAAFRLLSSGADSYTVAGAAEFVMGMEGNDTITGGAGNDTLNGCAGDDSMAGGAGNDIYYVQSAGDKVVEAAGAGSDTVSSSVTYTLGANIERLSLAGAAAISGFGNSLNNTIAGNSAGNFIRAYAGNDTINGYAGADTMYGGTGDDLFYVDNAGDLAAEFLGEGNDTVVSTISLVLRHDVENLTLSVNSATAFNATGNELDNVLTGNALNNVLRGEAGADSMYGGAGDDIYYVSDATDVTSDVASGGNDVIHASADHTMGFGIETMYLTGTAAVNGTGNQMANTIVGNAFANVIDGGAGVDTMTGGEGNDTYYVDVTADVVSETSSTGGTDTVRSTADNYTMTLNIESLILEGTRTINATGNYQANSMTGNDSANVLNGAGGNDVLIGAGGFDTLTGGTGRDTFAFVSLSDSGVLNGNRDIITDFVAGTDKISLILLDADTSTAGNDAFTTLLAADAAFTAAGQIKLEAGVLYLNTDADADAEMSVQLTGVTSVALTDFVL